MIIKQVYLESKRTAITVNVVQNTNAVPIKFMIIDYKIPLNAIARVYIKKPSGAEVYNNCTISTADNSILVQPTTQMYAEKGTAAMQVEVVTGGVVAKSFTISLIVNKDITHGTAIESSNEYGVLGDIIHDAQEALSGVENIDNITSGVVETHGAVGDAVTDDYVSLQATLDASLTVKLSMGRTYYTSKTLLVRSGHNIDMQGATIRVGGNYPAFSQTGIAVQKVRIFNGFLVGTAAADTYTTLPNQCGIKISCWNSSFYNLQFNTFAYGIYLAKRSEGTGTLVENKILDTKFVSCYYAGFFTEVGSKTSDGFLKNIKVGGDGYEYGINIDNAGGWIIDGIHCYGESQYKMRVANCDNTCLSNLYLAGDYTVTGLLVHVYSNALINNATIRGEKEGATMLYCTASTSTTYTDKVVNVGNITFSSKTPEGAPITSVNSIKGYTKIYVAGMTFNDPNG